MKTIHDLGKKIITIAEIQEHLKIEKYSTLVELINQLVLEGTLNEVKSSKSNGMTPPLYNKYRVNFKEEDLSTLEVEINYHFPLIFNREFYSNNLAKYQTDKVYIEKLSKYFRNNKNDLSISMAINERSFAIWGEEKFLKEGNGQGIIRNLGLSLADLNIYATPEPFVYFSCNKEKTQNVLIIENKDTWYTIRKLMLEGQNLFLGHRLDTIIYGSGKNIEKSLEEYQYTVEEYLLEPHMVLYWGDIDYEGILIYERLKKRYFDKLNIQLFKNAYAEMIRLSENKELPKCSQRQNKRIDNIFLEEMVSHRDSITKLLEEGYYIPQEIVNYKVLRGEG